MTKARLLEEMQRLRERVAELERQVSGRDPQKSGTLLASALENMSDAVFISDAAGNFIEFNEAFATYHRFSSKEECSRHISACFDRFEVFTADGKPALPEMWVVPRALRGESGKNVEYTLRLRSTGETWVGRYNFSPIRSPEGIILGAVVVAHEITEERHTAEILRESEQRLSFHMNNSPLGIVEWDTNFIVTRWSGEAERIFGWTAQETLGKRIMDLNIVFEDDIPHLLRVMTRLTSGVSRHVFSCNRNYTKDGKVIICEWYNSVLVDDQGKMLWVMSQVLDITERKMTEEALRQANEDQELAGQLRELATETIQTEQRERQRIASLLHDHVQQLLVSAQMQASLLRRSSSQPHNATFNVLEDILKEALRVATTLTIELFPPVLTQSGLSAAFGWLATYMKEKHCLEVHIHAEAEREPTAPAERTFLFESVRELLLNIRKHAGVREARVLIPAETEKRFTVIVEDDGHGFVPGTVKPGTRGGFGLFSLQQRLLYLGGTLLIDTAPGRGTRITLSIPLREGHSGEYGQRSSPSRKFDPIRVLLVDDHKMVRQGLTSLLELEADIEVVGEAENGREAIAKAHQLHPEVVILDVNMPEMDGIQTVSRLVKELPETKVIAISVYAEEHAANVMRREGAIEYVAKDSPMEHLIAAIRSCHGTPL